MSTASSTENWSTIAQSHARVRNSRQPVARSEMKRGVASCSTTPMRIRATIAAAMR